MEKKFCFSHDTEYIYVIIGELKRATYSCKFIFVTKSSLVIIYVSKVSLGCFCTRSALRNLHSLVCDIASCLPPDLSSSSDLPFIPHLLGSKNTPQNTHLIH